MGLDAFTHDLRRTATALRRLPNDVHTALGRDGRRRLTEPLAARIATSWSGPWAGALAASTRAVDAPTPTIRVGGTTPLLSGGATGTDLVWGTEYGSTGGRRTRQFRRHHHPTIEPTLDTATPQILDALADLVTDTLQEVL